MQQVRILSLAAAFLLAACGGGDSTAPTTTMAGSWSGTVSTQQPITLLLSESGGAVTGTGAIGNTSVSVQGTHQTKSPSTLTLTTSGGSAITFTVEVLLPASMSGHLNGGAYTDAVVILDKK